MTNRISVGLIAVILVIGFFTGSMGLRGAVLTTILVPILVHGGYILNYGLHAYKMSELGVHPYDFGYEYKGNGKYVHPDTGAWFQYNDHKAKEYKEGKGINIIPVFALYGTILVIVVVLMQFSSTGISEQDVYNDVNERVMSGELIEKFPDAKMSSKNDTKIEKLEILDPIESDVDGVLEAKYNVKGDISTQNKTLPFSYDVFYYEGVDGPIIIGGVEEAPNTDSSDFKTTEESNHVNDENYTNGRFGFSIDYPASFKSDYTPDNNDGIELYDDEAKITAFGNHFAYTNDDHINASEIDSIETVFDGKIADLKNDHYSISYQKLDEANNWFVISYVDEENIIYQKTILAEDFFAELIIEYPEDSQDKYESIIEKVVNSFTINNPK